jgi:predicted AAA+ superfamily ATPase
MCNKPLLMLVFTQNLCYNWIMFKRQIEKRLLDFSKNFPVVSLTGVRQSGKTTLIKKAFPDFEYFSLESPDTLLEIKNDTKLFLNKDTKGFIFDEAQRYPELFSYIQEHVDNKKKQK